MQGKAIRFFVGEIPRFGKIPRRKNNADRGRFALQYLTPFESRLEAGFVIVRPDDDMETAKRTCVCLSYSVGTAAPGDGCVFREENERGVGSLFSLH